jgi:hypothetical protein
MCVVRVRAKKNEYSLLESRLITIFTGPFYMIYFCKCYGSTQSLLKIKDSYGD